jgi:uncharacterized membrane protein YccC
MEILQFIFENPWRFIAFSFLWIIFCAALSNLFSIRNTHNYYYPKEEKKDE